MKKLIFAVIVLPFCSCAYMRSTTTRTPLPQTFSNFGTNAIGVAQYPYSEHTTVRVYTIFDGQAALAKFSNRSGYTTNGAWGPGTFVGGINENSSSSNLVDIIGAVAKGVVSGLKP